MIEQEYQAKLEKLRESWGEVTVVTEMPGMIRASQDPTTGLLAGRHASIIAEIINRALRGEYDQR